MINTTEINNERNSETRYILTEEKFTALKMIQQEIYKETEVTLSIRKIIDEILTSEILTQYKDLIIEQIRNYITIKKH